MEKGLLMVNAQIRSLGCALHVTMRLLSATIQKEPIAADREESPKSHPAGEQGVSEQASILFKLPAT